MPKYNTYRRLILRRTDGKTYLNRWGIGFRSIGTIMLHRMEAPDPGVDLHNHPWKFITIPLYGGYVEQRSPEKAACGLAATAERIEKSLKLTGKITRGKIEVRRPFRPRLMGLDECHTITKLNKKVAWSLVIAGPVKRDWGFFISDGYVPHKEYEDTMEGKRRGLYAIKPEGYDE